MTAIHNSLPELMKPHWFRLLVSLPSPISIFRRRESHLAQTTQQDLNALDSVLTAIGEEQVSHLRVKIKQEVDKGLPVPEAVFTSVARRACQTAMVTWGDIVRSVEIHAVHVSWSKEVSVRWSLMFPESTRLFERQAIHSSNASFRTQAPAPPGRL